MTEEQLPSPEKLSREIDEITETLERVVRAYKELYTASLRPAGGGSVGQIGGRGSASDPTSSAALSVEKKQLRSSAVYVARTLAKIQAFADRAEERGWKVWQELSGGAYREEYERRREVRQEFRVHRWTLLDCGCARDEEGWWNIGRRCAEHVPLIPEPYRTPFLAAPGEPTYTLRPEIRKARADSRLPAIASPRREQRWPE